MYDVMSERERQRFEHLVLGKARPKPARRSRRGPRPLAPGVEEQVQLRERWSHKAGTPETMEQVEQAKRRPGSLARLYDSGAIDRDQLAAAQAIAEVHAVITADVRVRTASLETRIDGGVHGRAEIEAVGRIWAELAYDWWRSAVGGAAEALLAVIVHDTGLTIVARHHGLSMPRARRVLTEALDLWGVARHRTARQAAIAAEP